MAKAEKAEISVSIQRQLTSLARRVASLEAALKPRKMQKSGIDPVWADFERKWAQRETRNKAMKDYYEQQRVARYRADPSLLEIAKTLEREERSFLRKRGLKPNPSRIPEEFRENRK